MATKLAKHLTSIGFSLRRAAKVRIDAGLIGRTSMFFGGGTTSAFTAIRIGFGVQAAGDPFSFLDVPALFKSIPITPTNVGQTFYEDATTNGHFGAVVSRLTNGIDDCAFLCQTHVPDDGSGGGSGLDESAAFKGSSLTGGIDFAGQNIRRIGMRIDELRFFDEEEEDSDGSIFVMHHFEGYVTVLIERDWRITTTVSTSDSH
jgi:hypothetical protein